MATFKAATSSLFDVVNQTSNAVVATVSVIGNSASMLNDFVERQRVKQADNTIVELLNHRETLSKNSALEMLKTDESIAKYIGSDAGKQTLYNDYLTKIQNALGMNQTED